METDAKISMVTINIGIILLLCGSVCIPNKLKCNYCDEIGDFFVIAFGKRSMQNLIYADNVDTIENCIHLTKSYKGLALNYRNLFQPRNLKGYEATGLSGRQHSWQQPQLYFNCHVLECPESSTLSHLVTDKNFDYYSLYEPSSLPSNYSCISGLGIFNLYTTPLNFWNAYKNCTQSNESCSLLSHVASEKRTNLLASLMREYNKAIQRINKGIKKVLLAYVNLHYNHTTALNKVDFSNSLGEYIQDIPYNAWEPGHPKTGTRNNKSICIALTARSTWITIDCTRKLPYICEIYSGHYYTDYDAQL